VDHAKSMNNTATPTRIVLDTDPGIDDALAILLALGSPELEVAAITVTGGNCPLEQGVRNALAVLTLAKRTDIPVCPGVALPLLRPPLTAPETHGDSGLGNARLPEPPHPPSTEHGVDAIVREIMARPGEVTLVAVGPLTNVALAVRKEPRIAQHVRELIIMGGALRADGNTTSLGEFNFAVDPHAAHIVLHSGFERITLVPWDITKNVQLRGEDVQRLLQIDSPITRFVADATDFYMEFHRQAFGYAGCSVNDPAALALAFLPDLATTEPVHVEVEYSSELTYGKSVITYTGDPNVPPGVYDKFGYDSSSWPRGWRRGFRHTPNLQLVTAFDTPRFIELFLERMERLARV
jgi:purine nucleosidase